MNRTDRRNLITGLSFISPWIIGFLLFTLVPVGASLYFSFCQYDVLQPPAWVGILNYQQMLTDDVFWLALWNTLFYAAFALPLGLIVSLLTAVLLNQDIRGRAFFRTACFLPSLVPLVAAAILWWWIFNGRFGILNYALSIIGIKGPQWLGDAMWTKPALIVMSVWSIGNSIVIYLAALQDVPRSLYESAQIDGAGPWGKLRHVTIPMISPVIYFNMVMGIIGCMQVFAQPFIMLPDGGPNRSALLYAVYLFQNAFEHLRMGYASAMAWVLFVIVLALTWLATRASRQHIHYENG